MVMLIKLTPDFRPQSSLPYYFFRFSSKTGEKPRKITLKRQLQNSSFCNCNCLKMRILQPLGEKSHEPQQN